MPSQKVSVRVEFPEGVRKLSAQEPDRLKSVFRTELANVLGKDAGNSLAGLEFENVTSPPVSGGGTLSAKKSGKKGSAKKSSRKG
jgi:hypothetical protein